MFKLLCFCLKIKKKLKINVLFIIKQCKSVYAMMLLSENEIKIIC